jgi:endoribonuclease Dicer
LPDIVEAYVGAMFVDSEFQYAEVQRFFDTHIKWFFEDMSIYDTFARSHPTTKLYLHLSTYMNCSDYCVMSRPLDDGSVSYNVAAVLVHGEVVADGRADSSKVAKVIASREALELIEGLSPFQFRDKFKCTCQPSEVDGSKNELDATIGTAI